jgi:hypothetical protein
MLRITHNAGFFSCCTVRLLDILGYFAQHQKLPEIVDSSTQFKLYKRNPSDDITNKFFLPASPTPDIPFTGAVPLLLNNDCVHFPNYKQVNYLALKPFIERYFSPAQGIETRITRLEKKYPFDPTRTCLVYYRGNDKALEVFCPSYSSVVEKALEVKQRHPEITTFLVQTDELQFLNYFKNKFPDVLVLSEIKPISKKMVNPGLTLPPADREEFACEFLAVAYFLSRAQYIVTNTHNTAFWLCLFRGSAEGVYQHLNCRTAIGTKLCPEKGYWFQ